MRVGQPNPRNWRNVPRKPRYIWLLATRQLARKRQRSLMSLLIHITGDGGCGGNTSGGYRIGAQHSQRGSGRSDDGAIGRGCR